MRQPNGTEMRTVLPGFLGGKPILRILHLPSWPAQTTLAQMRAAYTGLPAGIGAAARLCMRYVRSRDEDVRLLTQAIRDKLNPMCNTF